MIRALKSFVIGLFSTIGLLILLIVFLFVVGFPTFHDIYVESESKKSELIVFENRLVDVNIKFLPEVLGRLVIEVDFKKKSEQLFLKDFELTLIDSKSNKELEKIFDIRVYKPDEENPGFFDEVSLKKSFDELDLKSKYRDLSYTLDYQYDAEENKSFEALIKIKIQDSKTNQVLTLEKKVVVNKESEFKMEKLRVH
jgi:hypothetical protein